MVVTDSDRNFCPGDLCVSHREARSSDVRFPHTNHVNLTDCSPTFSLHANHPVRAEPLAADFLLQVKHPPSINLLVRDAVVMVTSPGTGPLGRGKEGWMGENIIRGMIRIGEKGRMVEGRDNRARTRTKSVN